MKHEKHYSLNLPTRYINVTLSIISILFYFISCFLIKTYLALAMVSQALKTKEMKVLLKYITKTAKTNMYVTS